MEFARMDKNMNKKTSELQVGDVVVSRWFKNGEQNSRFQRDLPIEVGINDEPRGFTNATDATRMTAKFVVLHTMIEGNVIIQQGENDYWTRIYAKRLNDDGSFNADGEVITFTNSTSATIEEVELVGRMTMLFVPERDCASGSKTVDSL